MTMRSRLMPKTMYARTDGAELPVSVVLPLGAALPLEVAFLGGDLHVRSRNLQYISNGAELRWLRRECGTRHTVETHCCSLR